MLNFMMELINKFAGWLCDILPTSPFRQYIDSFSNLPFLGYLNWFIPVRSILTVLAAWLGSIALFYMYSIVMRWVKMIGD